MASVTRDGVFDEIRAERDRQQEKWQSEHPWGTGDCSSPHVAETVKMAVLAQECGEVARAVLDQDSGDTDLRTELIQVAAVAVAWLEATSARLPL